MTVLWQNIQLHRVCEKVVILFRKIISNETQDEKHDKLIRIIIKINIIRVCVPDNITQKYKIHCTVVFRPMYDAPPDGAMVADVSQETGNRKPNSQINY